jgi:hypothetical protein
LDANTSKSVSFLALSKESPDCIADYLSALKGRNPINFTVGCDAEAATDALSKMTGSKSVPHAYIIDEEGMVEWNGHPTHVEKHLTRIVSVKDARDEEQ